MYRAFAISAIFSFMMAPALADDFGADYLASTKIGRSLTTRGKSSVSMVTINECKLSYVFQAMGTCEASGDLKSETADINLRSVGKLSAHVVGDSTEFILSGRPDISSLTSETFSLCGGEVHHRSSLSEATFSIPELVGQSVFDELSSYIQTYCE
ncbi:hypothetical protein [Salipiger sp. PrR003]|uniref:hypothetical protein n=1 Tax=Salipiger sp. PrR003 TaxID=2706776 RepID=UPI0013DC4F0D|nr:hypothetical protein [Salipiger sp. PrR003]NDV50102.1 hypothetical protein [Salipiger sp. PrR003]